MKILKTIYQVLIVSTITLFICTTIGCGKDSRRKTAVTPQQCGVGSIWSPVHNQCLPQCTEAGYAVDPNSNRCIYVENGVPNNRIGNFNYTWEGSMNVINKKAYRNFLEEYAQVCNRFVGWNWGTANCKAWDEPGDLYIETQGLKPPTDGAATIWVRSGTYSTISIPISINGQFDPINNNQGFELRRTGLTLSPSYNKVISVIADRQSVLTTEGHITDRFQVRLVYNNKVFVKATMHRRQ